MWIKLKWRSCDWNYSSQLLPKHTDKYSHKHLDLIFKGSNLAFKFHISTGQIFLHQLLNRKCLKLVVLCWKINNFTVHDHFPFTDILIFLYFFNTFQINHFFHFIPSCFSESLHCPPIWSNHMHTTIA